MPLIQHSAGRSKWTCEFWASIFYIENSKLMSYRVRGSQKQRKKKIRQATDLGVGEEEKLYLKRIQCFCSEG